MIISRNIRSLLLVFVLGFGYELLSITAARANEIETQVSLRLKQEVNESAIQAELERLEYWENENFPENDSEDEAEPGSVDIESLESLYGIGESYFILSQLAKGNNLSELQLKSLSNASKILEKAISETKLFLSSNSNSDYLGICRSDQKSRLSQLGRLNRSSRFRLQNTVGTSEPNQNYADLLEDECQHQWNQ